MKKRRFLLIALLCCFVFAGSILVACNGEDSDFTVSFDTQGGSNIAEITVGNGQVIGEVAPPTKQCARFIGFALDAGGERMWNLQTDTMSANITLYAIWEDTHTWGEWETLTEPTCTAEGAHKHICEVCGKEETENISKTEHDFTTWEYDENHHWKICSRCGAISEKTAHVYDTDGKCECGAIAATPASEFTFTDLGNNTWRVDGYSGSDNEIVIPSRYNGGKVISIGYEAFEYCDGLTSVTIPDGVTSIGSSVFYNCTGLTSITIPDGVTSIGMSAFYGTGLTSVTIPDSVTRIGDRAFYDCSGLTSVTIGEGVTRIWSYAFSGCTGLTEINWNAVSVADLGSDVFDNAGTAGDGIAVTFGESVQRIPAYLFRSSYSPNIKSVIIGSNVTSIGNRAFSGCTGLTSITIPDSVTSIGEHAFYNCSGLTSIYYTGDITGWLNISGLANLTSRISSECKLFLDGTIIGGDIIIPDGVESIPSYAFAYQTGITSVTIGDSVTSIESHAFSGCSGLKSITIPFVGAEADNTSSDPYQYRFGYIFGTTSYTGGTGVGLIYDSNGTIVGSSLTYYIPSSLREVTVTGGNIFLGAFYGCNGLTSVTIGDGVTRIGDFAFSGCSGLTAVTIGDGVTNIGDGAFAGCLGLTSITIPDSVTSIGLGAFGECTGLKSITIPDSVTSIGSSAFAYCTGLTSITIPDSVTSIGAGAFAYCRGLTSITFEETSGWFISTSPSATSGTNISADSLSDKSTAAQFLGSGYSNYYWKRNA